MMTKKLNILMTVLMTCLGYLMTWTADHDKQDQGLGFSPKLGLGHQKHFAEVRLD